MASEPMPADSGDRATTQILGRLRAHRGPAQRYRMAGEVARGGMGAILKVWDDDLRRPLAMKVVLGGEDGSGETPTPDEIDHRRMARFLEEAQITGQLEHPGIVPVHELGIDEQGRAYFTMRLVRGRDLESLLTRIDKGEEQWSQARLLDVLLRVAEALAFAHDRKVLHRDLKPANVMIGQFGEVYVMDWGLARVLDEPDRHDLRLRTSGGSSVRIATDRGRREADSDPNLYTMDGDIVGTPAYMSPEQARGEIEAIDVRSDVYALGAMLYRVLAGHAPFCDSGSRPATHILFDLLKGPPTPLASACPRAPAELHSIADKAMARSPADRYQSAMAFADDLRAFLEQRVVTAYETGAWAEARKWIRRNRALAASLSAAVLLLVAGLLTSLMLKHEADRQSSLATQQAGIAAEQATRAEQQARLAESQRAAAVAATDRAEREAAVARAVSAFLNDEVLATVAPENLGVGVTVQEALAVAAQRLDFHFADRPDVESALRLTIGASFRKLGQPQLARRQLERAVELRTRELGAAASDTLQARLQLAGATADLGDVAGAEAAIRGIRADAVEAFGEDHEAVQIATNDLALLLANGGRRGEARELYEACLAAQTRLRGAEEEQTVTTRANLGTLLTQMGDYEAAEPLLTSAVANRKQKLGARHPLTIDADNALALLRLAQGRLQECRDLFEDVVARSIDVYGTDHVSTGRVLGSLGMVRTQLGLFEQARQDLEQAVAILQRRLGEEHAWTLLANNNLAACLVDSGHLAQALPLREHTLTVQKRALGPEHPETMLSMSNLAALYNSLGRGAEAEQLGRETLELQERVLGPDHESTLVTRENLGGVLFRRGAYGECQRLVLQVLEGRKRALGDEHPAVTRTMYNLAMIRRANGDDEGAEPLFAEVLQRNRRDLPARHPAIGDTLARLAACRQKAKDFVAAEACYREAIEIREHSFDPDTPECTVLHHDLGVMLLVSGDAARAEQELRTTWERRRRVHGDDHDYTLTTGYALGAALVALANHAAAEPLLLAFQRHREQQHGIEDAQCQRCMKKLAELCEATGRDEQAAAWRAKLR